jgi:GTPase
MAHFESSFIDRIRLRLKAGDGGNGITSFRHEKYVPMGGPDGGDGGNGGSIFFRVNPGMNTLESLHSQPYYKAENAKKGGSNNRSGAYGEDVILEVPPGTVVINEETGDQIVDMEDIDDIAIIAQGGHGGRGNSRFATSTNQAPRKSTDGKPGEELTVVVELKMVAHVGLIGLPNAGKSTLISTVTRARPRIANYPFTTLQPILGTITLLDGASLVIADIPGIIEGAHAGIGLGLDFLRHIERTKILIYVIEISPHDPSIPVESFKALQHEIKQYDATIIDRPYLIVLNKTDLLDDEEELQMVKQTFCEENPDIPLESIFTISALQNDGIEKLRTAIIEKYIDLTKAPIVEDSNSVDSELNLF